MSGVIPDGPKLQALLMWGAVPLRMAPSGRPSWLSGQRWRVWVYGWLLERRNKAKERYAKARYDSDCDCDVCLSGTWTGEREE